MFPPVFSLNVCLKSFPAFDEGSQRKFSAALNKSDERVTNALQTLIPRPYGLIRGKITLSKAAIKPKPTGYFVTLGVINFQKMRFLQSVCLVFAVEGGLH